MFFRNRTGSKGLGNIYGRGRMGGDNAGAGPSGYCICPQCGKKVSHGRGVPCFSIKCPQCDTRMTRE